jgi:hypothetical protein
MRNSLKTRTTDRDRAGLPPESRRIEIMLELVKMQHFAGIWYNGTTIGVRRFADGTPEYLSWSEAVRMIEVAALVRKPPESLKSGRKTGSSAA